jgi:hypothetical protein
MWLKARDEGTDDPDGEHSGIYRIGGIILAPDEGNSKVDSDEDEDDHNCNTEGSQAQSVACHSGCQLVGTASADQHGAEDREIGHILMHSIGDLHHDRASSSMSVAAP